MNEHACRISLHGEYSSDRTGNAEMKLNSKTVYLKVPFSYSARKKIRSKLTQKSSKSIRYITYHAYNSKYVS